MAGKLIFLLTAGDRKILTKSNLAKVKTIRHEVFWEKHTSWIWIVEIIVYEIYEMNWFLIDKTTTLPNYIIFKWEQLHKWLNDNHFLDRNLLFNISDKHWSTFCNRVSTCVISEDSFGISQFGLTTNYNPISIALSKSRRCPWGDSSHKWNAEISLYFYDVSVYF